LAGVVDVADPRLADYRDLPGAERRDAFVAEGALVVERLIAATRFPLRSVLCTESALARLEAALRETRPGTPVYVAPTPALARIVGYQFHRGALAAADRPPELAAEAVIERGRASRRPLVLLDDVANPDNVGGVFRNARAFGASGVLLAGGCCDPLYRKALRVSMGGALEVPWATAADLPATLTALRAAGFTLLALTPDGDADVADVVVPVRAVLLLGAERRGLGAAACAAAHRSVRIAMAPGADSLNVATAAAIALHRLAAHPRVVQ
jgi:tRNA G18 (ribose-2'-O)-methylase SpoU